MFDSEQIKAVDRLYLQRPGIRHDYVKSILRRLLPRIRKVAASAREREDASSAGALDRDEAAPDGSCRERPGRQSYRPVTMIAMASSTAGSAGSSASPAGAPFTSRMWATMTA